MLIFCSAGFLFSECQKTSHSHSGNELWQFFNHKSEGNHGLHASGEESITPILFRFDRVQKSKSNNLRVDIFLLSLLYLLDWQVLTASVTMGIDYFRY